MTDHHSKGVQLINVGGIDFACVSKFIASAENVYTHGVIRRSNLKSESRLETRCRKTYGKSDRCEKQYKYKSHVLSHRNIARESYYQC